MDLRSRHLLAACMVVALVPGIAGCALDIGSDGRTVEGSGDIQEEERSVAGIEAVEVANEGDLIVEIGDTERLVVEAQQELLPYIETAMDGGTMVISTREDYELDPSEPIRYRLTVPTLAGLKTTSSGGIEAPGLTVDALEIRVTSSGSVAIEELQASDVTVEISSSGDVVIGGGTVDEQTVRLTSSGSYAAEELASKRATVELTSSGDASIRVSDSLEARLSSSGNLYCVGSPTVDAQTSSSGDVVTTPE